ncbi:Hpt domain-containing protein [Albimonas sp. CAU 1670]|uniref:Hpt domain-containing protein n=1 Tax=Albimonas sp. CAU 1670 TaxID=3032599 RepID=UPI0023D97B60|nr:Hpt domain-containing protein [Albimonas sp. CAU 1670]MDF2232379.1 Hpt domain-containing protein [Albimonas sp. CAU 1670]
MIDAGLRQELRKLIESFVVNMRAMTAEIEAAVEDGRQGARPAAEVWDVLRAVAHRISGSGASFGFVEIAAVARRIDLRAAGVLEGGAPACATPPWTDDEVLRDLPALRALVDAAAATDSPLYPKA